MKSLLILGAGGYGRYVKELAELLEYEKVDFLDDYSPLAIGKLEDIDKLQSHYDETIVAMGNFNLRKKYLLHLKNPAILIHPNAIVSKSAQIEKGVVVEAQCVINTGAKVKKGSFLCAGAVVNHDAVVETCCQIDCNAVVSNFAVVPTCTKVMSCRVWNNNYEEL